MSKHRTILSRELTAGYRMLAYVSADHYPDGYAGLPDRWVVHIKIGTPYGPRLDHAATPAGARLLASEWHRAAEADVMCGRPVSTVALGEGDGLAPQDSELVRLHVEMTPERLRKLAELVELAAEACEADARKVEP